MLTKADEWTCRPEVRQEKAAVDGSVGDGTPPVSSLAVHHFVLEFLYLNTAFCIIAFDKGLAPADRSRHAPAPPIEKLICGVICQPILRLCQTVTHTGHLQINQIQNICGKL